MKAEQIIILRHAPCIRPDDDKCAYGLKVLTEKGYRRTKKFFKLAIDKGWLTDWQATYCACSPSPRAHMTMYAIMGIAKFEFSRFHCDQVLSDMCYIEGMLNLAKEKAEKYQQLLLITHLEQITDFHHYWADKVWHMKNISVYSLLEKEEKAPLSAVIIDVKEKKFGVMMAE